MRRALIFLAAATLVAWGTISAGLAIPARAQDAGLIGHWTLDEGAGPTAADAAGDAPGLLVGDPLWQPAGRLGGALSFDGVDDRVDLGSPDYGSPPTGLTDSLAITLWMKAEAYGTSDARLVSRAVGVDDQDHVFMVSTIDGTGLRFRLKVDGFTATLASEPGVLAPGRWHHVAAVYDGLEILLYCDGLALTSAPLSGMIDSGSGVGMALGNQPKGAGERPFDGVLDDVRLYRRALTPTELGSLAFPDGNEQPVALFTATPTSGPPPLPVRFDAAPSFDRDGDIVRYVWSFGDGSAGNGIAVTHIYQTPGTYRVHLAVGDDEDAYGIADNEVTIVPTPSKPLSFTHEVIDAAPPDYIHCKAASDVDGDGLKDVLAAGAKNGDGFFWYRNPGWERFTIVPPGVTGFSTDMTMGDVDGDGDFDAIIPKGFDYGNTVVWYENPRPAGDPEVDPWPEHQIGPAGAHDVEGGDVDGNGLLDVMVRWQETFLFLQTAPDTWQRTIIGSRGDEGLDLADLDLDGDLDAVINGHWLENPRPGGNPGAGVWSEHPIDATRGTDVRVKVTDLDRDGRPDVIFAASESTGQPVSWYEADDPVGGPWTEHPVIDALDYVHSLEAADMDLDGAVDIIAAEMHQSSDPDRVVVFRNRDEGQIWEPLDIATTGSHNMVVTDLDDDGDVDLIGANHAQPPLEWWRNDLDPLSLLALDRWDRHVIDPGMPWRAVFVETALIDDDLLPDVVAGGWWYRNPGSAGGSWGRSAFGSLLKNMATVYDFDRDGDKDVLGTGGTSFLPNNNFALARNDGSGGFTVLENIDSGEGAFLQGVAVAKFGYLNPLQVALSWNDGTDTQMLTVPSDPSLETWSLVTESDASLGEELDVGDIDRDGDRDILQGIQWLRNDGDGWTAFEIFPPTPPGWPDRARLADLNRDGRLDALVGYGHDRPYGSLSWYEQPPVATDPWIEHVIDHPTNPHSLDLGDLDLDGDLDLVVGEHDKAVPERSRLIIYENLGGEAAGFRRLVIYTGDEHHDGTRLLDVEGDGDLDIVSIGYTHNRVHLYENLASPGYISPVQPEAGPAVPSRFILYPPFPNPFNPTTRIRFELPVSAHVRLFVYDVRGRLVARLEDRPREAGVHEVVFTPRGLASGVYLAQLKAAGQVQTIRMLLLQ